MSVFTLPDDLSLRRGRGDADELPHRPLRARRARRLREGETVLVHGAAGGVGTATIQVAKGYGARTIAVVSTEEKAELARRAGADEAVLLDGFKDAVLGLTDGEGVDIVLDVVGGDVFTDSLRSLAPQGRLLVVGFASGQGIPEVKVNRLLLNNVDVRGVGWGAYAMVRPGYMHEQWDALLPMMESGVDQAADRGDVRARGVRPGAGRHGASAGPWASRSSASETDPPDRLDPRLGSIRDDSRRRPRGHEPRHPSAGRPVRPRQRALARRDRDPLRPVELGAVRAAGRRRRGAGHADHRGPGRDAPPASSSTRTPARSATSTPRSWTRPTINAAGHRARCGR